jgi:hypothetical protein
MFRSRRQFVVMASTFSLLTLSLVAFTSSGVMLRLRTLRAPRSAVAGARSARECDSLVIDVVGLLPHLATATRGLAQSQSSFAGKLLGVGFALPAISPALVLPEGLPAGLRQELFGVVPAALPALFGPRAPPAFRHTSVLR